MNSIKKDSKAISAGRENGSRKGFVFIPDISGFTELVHNTDMITGKAITFDLLSVIIEHNILDMEVAEIEGDAIFFFKWQFFPSIKEIMEQFELLRGAFNKKLVELEQKYRIHLKLQLKAIAHYGTMSEYLLSGFRKLYGEVVVEAHRLLKNQIPDRSYLLITNEFKYASKREEEQKVSLLFPKSKELCEMYDGLRNICFSYFQFNDYMPVIG